MIPLSTMWADATGDGALASTAPAKIVWAGDDLSLGGSLQALDSGADITFAAGGLLAVDALVKAHAQVVLNGGSHTPGTGLLTARTRYTPGA
jgi:hypothetical protein